MPGILLLFITLYRKVTYLSVNSVTCIWSLNLCQVNFLSGIDGLIFRVQIEHEKPKKKVLFGTKHFSSQSSLMEISFLKNSEKMAKVIKMYNHKQIVRNRRNVYWSSSHSILKRPNQKYKETVSTNQQTKF